MLYFLNYFIYLHLLLSLSNILLFLYYFKNMQPSALYIPFLFLYLHLLRNILNIYISIYYHSNMQLLMVYYSFFFYLHLLHVFLSISYIGLYPLFRMLLSTMITPINFAIRCRLITTFLSK